MFSYIDCRRFAAKPELASAAKAPAMMPKNREAKAIISMMTPSRTTSAMFPAVIPLSMMLAMM